MFSSFLSFFHITRNVISLGPGLKDNIFGLGLEAHGLGLATKGLGLGLELETKVA